MEPTPLGGEQDRWFFEALLCGAPRPQLKRNPLGGNPSYSSQV